MLSSLAPLIETQTLMRSLSHQDLAVQSITVLFFFLVLLAATQDIAVDGWALTLLSRRHVGYAATCQTVGMNVGYFTSFTVFLALNDADFCNAYFRTHGAVSVGPPCG